MDALTLSKAAGISLPRAQQWAEPLTTTMAEFGVDTPVRQAAFISQWAHESGGFAYTREIWGPTSAQRGYEGRADLGNTEPGDGKRFMGRGLPQLTGRANYRKASGALGVDLVKNPQLLEGTELAARAAGWFWKDRGLNAFADAGDFVGLTRRINGGIKGLADRRLRWAAARKALGVDAS